MTWGSIWPQLPQRLAPTLAGLGMAWLVFIPRLVDGRHGVWWLWGHSLCGPLEAPGFSAAVPLTHTDVFFSAILLFMTSCHLFSMRKPTVILSFVGSFLWVAAALGHYR